MSSSSSGSRLSGLLALSLFLLLSLSTSRIPPSPSSSSSSSVSAFASSLSPFPSSLVADASIFSGLFLNSVFSLSSAFLPSGSWELQGVSALPVSGPAAMETGVEGQRYQRQIQVSSFLADKDFRRLFHLTNAFEASTVPHELAAFVALRFFPPSFAPAFSASSKLPKPLVNALCQRVQSLLASSPLASSPLSSSSRSSIAREKDSELTLSHLLQARRLMACDFKIPRGLSAGLAAALVSPSRRKTGEDDASQVRRLVAALISLAEITETQDSDEQGEEERKGNDPETEDKPTVEMSRQTEPPRSSFLKSKLKDVHYLDLADAVISYLQKLQNETRTQEGLPLSGPWKAEAETQHASAAALLALSQSVLLLSRDSQTQKVAALQRFTDGLKLLERELRAVVLLGEETDSRDRGDGEDSKVEERNALRLSLLLHAYFNFATLAETRFSPVVFPPSLARLGEAGLEAAIGFLQTIPLEESEPVAALLPLLNAVQAAAQAGAFGVVQERLQRVEICDVWGRPLPADAQLHVVLSFQSTIDGEKDEEEEAKVTFSRDSTSTPSANRCLFSSRDRRLERATRVVYFLRRQEKNRRESRFLLLRERASRDLGTAARSGTPTDPLPFGVDLEVAAVPVYDGEIEQAEREEQILFRSGTRQPQAEASALLAKTHELRFTLQLATDWRTAGRRDGGKTSGPDQVSLLITFLSPEGEDAVKAPFRLPLHLRSRQIRLPLVNAKKHTYQLQLSLDNQRLFPRLTGDYRFELLVADRSMQSPLRLHLLDKELVFSRPVKLLHIPTGDGEMLAILPVEKNMLPAPLLSWENSPPPQQASLLAAILGAALCCLLPSGALWMLWRSKAIDVPHKIGEPSALQVLFIGAIVVQGLIVVLYFFCIAFLQLLPVLGVSLAVTSLIGYRALCQSRAQQLNESGFPEKKTF
ncbi:hypothetical protein TGARI_267590 [Toxoplasma gondii ARI]|uniref:Transmembrane protein n=1 Tax=Toxoplasma gondii ARI TaxID=1074872 RepID=A0A139Y3K7_TOXGO|nr:hypothetical protein TGARI_267590 [Toxoplasma gondii ARI]